MTDQESAPRNQKRASSGLMTSMAVVISVVLHGALFLVVGSFVIFEGQIPRSLFEAVGGSVEAPEFQDELEAPPLMEDEVLMEEVESPLQDPMMEQSLPVEAVDTNDIIAASTTQSAFSMPPGFNAVQAGPDVTLTTNSRSQQSRMNDLAKKGPGIPRTANIFGRTITATRFAAILDISFSTHETIDVAVEEITEGFPDALLVLTPGCGMIEGWEGQVVDGGKFEKDHTERDDSRYRSCGDYLRGLLRSNEDFKELWEDAKDENRAYVLETAVGPKVEKALAEMEERYRQDGRDPKKFKLEIMYANQHVFPFLIEQNCDTLYWMADFNDRIDRSIAEDLCKQLKRNDVKVVLHDFNGGNQTEREEKRMFAEETGGDIIIGNGE